MPHNNRGRMLSAVFSVTLCILIPLGMAGLLIAATVANFSPRATEGWCHTGASTPTQAVCTTLNSGPPSYDLQYKASLPGIDFTRVYVNATTSPDKTCTLMRIFNDRVACIEFIEGWQIGSPPEPCWHDEGKSWWLGSSHPECWFEEPHSIDAFDRTLPLTCAAALLLGASCFWIPKAKRWWVLRQRARRRRNNEGQPLLQRGSVPCVVKHGTVDLFSVSAVWMGEEAAVIVGNAEGGQYPCEVQRVFDVGTTVQGECVVCLENNKAVVLWPCRHLCVCVDCAPRIKKCPICRGHIRRRLCLELTQLEANDSGDENEGDDESEAESEESEEPPAVVTGADDVRSNATNRQSTVSQNALSGPPMRAARVSLVRAPSSAPSSPPQLSHQVTAVPPPNPLANSEPPV
eukprot:TRINITY_DN1402_c0_g1_i1.p1 TRINITY_DN1402_c0_g1~~TRINITY_DN1402_c0_g1_i1.p1  ORF type:complete len:404 (+),score=65.78 TRINITY_DN1402_c0_g1_i1:180-1391(+)